MRNLFLQQIFFSSICCLGRIPVHANFTGRSYDTKTKNVLSERGHQLNRRIKGGPWDIGFDSSYITIGGVQVSNLRSENHNKVTSLFFLPRALYFFV